MHGSACGNSRYVHTPLPWWCWVRLLGNVTRHRFIICDSRFFLFVFFVVGRAARMHTYTGMAVWFDVKMEDRSSAAMQRGVENSSCVIAIITGPVTNPDCPEDLPAQNAYFARPFCVNELRWAKAAGIPIQPVIRSADKTRIGELMAAAPEDLQDLINTDFITVDRSDLDYWKVGVQKIMRAANKVSRTKSNSSSGGPPQSPPVATYMPPSGTYVPPPPQYQ